MRSTREIERRTILVCALCILLLQITSMSSLLLVRHCRHRIHFFLHSVSRFDISFASHWPLLMFMIFTSLHHTIALMIFNIRFSSGLLHCVCVCAFAHVIARDPKGRKTTFTTAASHYRLEEKFDVLVIQYTHTHTQILNLLCIPLSIVL